MTKKQLADTIITGKQGGNTALYSKLDRRDVYFHADAAYSEVIGKARIEMGADFEESDFIKKFDIDQMYFDRKRNQTFFQIPVPIVDGGLMGVSPPRGNDFILDNAGDGNIYDTMESSCIYNNTVVVHEGDRVYFSEEGKKNCCVTIRCIPKASAYKDYEELPVPSVYEGYFMQRLLDFIENQRIIVYKTKKDNNANTGT